MVLFEHFNNIHMALMPNACGSRTRVAKVGNVVAKDISSVGLDLRVERVGDSMLPQEFTFEIVQPFLERNLGTAFVGTMMSERSKKMQVLSRHVRPYGGPPIAKEEGAIKMRDVFLVTSSPEGFHSSATIRKVIQTATGPNTALRHYMDTHLLIVSADFHGYWGALEACRCARGEYE
jgi:hypothetical protein